MFGIGWPKTLRRPDMADVIKFKILAILATALVVLILSYNILEESLFSGIEGYLERRLYYERVISKKDLSLHKGMYWRKEREGE